jgi:molybdate transport system substrate-binding protein
MADAVTGITSMATRHVLAELAEEYERRTEQRVVVESVGGVDAAKRVREGEPFDFVVLATQAMDELVAANRLDGTTRVDIARSGLAIARPAGARRIDLDTEAAIRDAVLAARSIGYSTGPSGRHVMRLFVHWGIAETVASRMLEAPPGIAVGTLVARGDAEIGFQQLSELIHVGGIEVCDSLPPEVQLVTAFAGAVCRSSTYRAEASALLAFFTLPEARAVKRRHGMDA